MAENKDSSFASPPAAIQARRQLDDARRFLDTGKFSEAQDVTREILGQHPDYVAALTTLGQAYLAEQNFDAALPCFTRASMLCADEPSILTWLAEVYYQLGSSDIAIPTAKKALTLEPGKSVAHDAHLLLGRIYEHQGDYDSAIVHLTDAQSMADGSLDAILLLGVCYLETGDAKKATAAFSAVLKGGVGALEHAETLYNLSQIANPALAKKLLPDLKVLEADAPSFNMEDDELRFSAHLNFARASLLERLGQPKDAWEALEAANAPFDKIYSEFYQHLRGSDDYTIERAAGWIYAGPPMVEAGDDLPLSLFILGSSRSGKTTLERLVSSLKGVESGHEHELVQKSACETATSNGFLPLNYPGQLPTAMHRQFTKIYMRNIAARGQGTKVLTCTHPGLIPDLGRIAETVPNLRVVFVRRDSSDTAFRIFGKVYPEGTNPFAYNVASIQEHLEGYGKLVEAWSEALEGITMQVTYEDMVSDPQRTLELVAEFCGLDASKAKASKLVDDRDCAKPYLDHLENAQQNIVVPLSGWASPE